MLSSLSSLTSKAKHGFSSEAEPSLTTILPTTSDRTELTLLLANITESMRNRIESNFAAEVTADDPYDTNVLDAPPLPPRPEPQAQTQKSKKPEDRAWVDFVKSDISEQEKVRQEMEKRKKELSTEKMQTMKNQGLQQFDDWRAKMLMRVGEVVNSREDQADHQHAPPQESERDKDAEKQISRVEDAPAVKAEFEREYPPQDTPLSNLAPGKKALILHSMLLLLLSLEQYSAWSRVLLLHLTSSLGLSIKLLEQDEAKTATGLLQAVDMSGDAETKEAAKKNATSRKWKVGIATVAGAALIGITGGLAAPLLAAGVGTVMGGLGLGATATAGYLGTLAGSSLLIGGLFGAYGGKMTGAMMDNYAKEVEDFAFIPVRPASDPTAQRRLRVTVGISGWLSSAEDVDAPWTVLGPTSAETFALRFELKALLALGNGLTALLTSAAWSYAKTEIIRRTVFASLTAALWPIGLLKAGRVVDNPWAIAKQRADKAGVVLADALINRAQGERPVSLVGYSLGARVVFVCLKTMAERGAFGLVEDVVLLGAPCPSDALDWHVVRAVAAGRVVNAYSENDYVLGYLYRSASVQLGVAGLQAVDARVRGVRNVDCGADVAGHTAWRFGVGRALREAGWSDLVDSEVERQMLQGRRQGQEEEEGREKAVERGGDEDEDAQELSDEKIRAQLEKGE